MFGGGSRREDLDQQSHVGSCVHIQEGHGCSTASLYTLHAATVWHRKKSS